MDGCADKSNNCFSFTKIVQCIAPGKRKSGNIFMLLFWSVELAKHETTNNLKTSFAYSDLCYQLVYSIISLTTSD